MNTSAIVSMSNSIGSLLQGIACGKAAPVIQRILLNHPDTEVYIPDEGIDVKGYDNCLSVLTQLAAQQYGYIDLTHSNAYRENPDGSVMGHWNTYTYKLYTDAEGSHILYSYWRLTATFVDTEDGWKMKSLSKLLMLHVDPWDYDSTDEPGLLDQGKDFSFDLDGTCADPQDYVELRNIVGHISQDGIYNCRSYFALDHELYLHLPEVMDAPSQGRDAVMKAIDDYERLERKNQNLYINFVTACTPIIVTEGDTAHASFMGNIVNYRGTAFGYEAPPFRFQSRIAVLYVDFVREDGVWKVTSYRTEQLLKINDIPYKNDHHDGTDGYPNRVEFMYRSPNHNFAPVWQGVKNCAEDIFEIESMLPEWTERLKTHDIPSFPDLFMTCEQHAPVIQLSRNYFGYEKVVEHCNHVINGMIADYPTMWDNPQVHTGCSPVIELSRDGLSAKAWWIDKAFGNIGAAKFFDNESIRAYYPGIGTYCHEFVKENGRWRMWHFGWTPTAGWNSDDPDTYKYTYHYGKTGGWSVNRNGREWPLPFEDFRY